MHHIPEQPTIPKCPLNPLPPKKPIEETIMENPIQSEYNLSKDAYFQNYTASLQDLSQMAQQEEWNLKSQQTPNYVLSNYINFTYDRLKEENKLQISSDSLSMCFNTGLLNSYDQEIYAYFENGINPKTNNHVWVFNEYKIETDSIIRNKFSSLPQMANYFTEPSDFIYDTNKKLTMDYVHIIDDNYDRFVEIGLNDKYMIESLLKAASERIKKWIQRNYKLAVPQYYTNKYTSESKIQLLLPLYLTSKKTVDLVLVVDKGKYDYIGKTILTPEWAYLNARRISRPNSDWLTI